jgi:prepilin-type N-terminal cleavage/methylation domain-containing protein
MNGDRRINGCITPPRQAVTVPARGSCVSTGFTLVELVLVIVLVGVIAVVAVARMPSQTVFIRRR